MLVIIVFIKILDHGNSIFFMFEHCTINNKKNLHAKIGFDEALLLNVDHLSEAEHININSCYFTNIDKK